MIETNNLNNLYDGQLCVLGSENSSNTIKNETLETITNNNTKIEEDSFLNNA